MRLFAFLSTLFLPSLAFAQITAPKDFAELVGIILNIISLFIPIIFGITFIVLGWGIIKAWILKSGDASAVEKGKQLVVVGIIGLVVMAGMWGILKILRDSFFGS